MKIAIVQRYKIDEDGDGIYYTTGDNKHMFKSYGVDLIIVDDKDKAEQIAKECDGLCVPGGADVDPKFYHEELNGTRTHYDWLDELDFAYIDAFHKEGKPILGICRGHQIINVFFGGTLYQDMPNHWGVRHNVIVPKDSFIRKIYDVDVLNVNSFHHQAVKDIAPGFKVEAKSEDGYIEAMKYKNIYTVQWHPEMYDGPNFIKHFIDNCF